MDEGFFEELSGMVGERVRVQTPDAVYRGSCRSIDGETFSFLLDGVEELTMYGRPAERDEEEWREHSEKMMIHGDYVETVSVVGE